MAQQEPEDTFLLHDRSQEIEAIKRSFSPSQQTLRWFLVVVSVTFHLASFKIYEDKDNLDSTQVRSFNVITTVLALVLGLCFFVSLFIRIRLHRSRSMVDRPIGCI